MVEWYYLVLASAAFLGLGAIVEKNTLKVEHATQFSAAFSWIIFFISLLVLLPLNSFYSLGISFSISPTQLALIFVSGIFASVGYLISARVFKHGNMSAISPIATALPIFFLVVLAVLFLGEDLNIYEYVGIGGIIVTTYFIIFSTGSGKKQMKQFDSNYYKYLLILNAMASGVSMLVTKYILSNNNPFSFLIILEFFMAVNFTIYITKTYGGIKEIFSTIYQYRTPVFAVAILTLLYRICYYVALTVAPVSVAYAMRNSVYVIITVLAAGEFFKEQGFRKKLALSVIMIVFAYILAISSGAVNSS